jgi:hypothetical protein
LDLALNSAGTFKLDIDANQVAISWWVSAKRTRSYPYARVYDSLGFSGKKITIIPIFKDEGKDGDRDYLQWDTISLMSLLGIYVIIAYYVGAEPNPRYANKITNQRFDIEYLKSKIRQILLYQSDAIHWNVKQTDGIMEIGNLAIESYKNISNKLGVELHSLSQARERLDKISKDMDSFMNLSRELAKQAQDREGSFDQPHERVDGSKSKITIINWLGGKYYFTADEVHVHEKYLYLIEAKHTSRESLPSISDIKDGLLKMDLFSNLEEVKLGNKKYKPIPVLKLTTKEKSPQLSKIQRRRLRKIVEEGKINGFKVHFNGKYITSKNLHEYSDVN